MPKPTPPAEKLLSGKRRPFAIIAAALLLLAVVLLASVALLKRRNQTVGLKQEIQYDDFGYSVLGAVKTTSVGSYRSQHSTEGQFYVVTMKVANHARQVNYSFDKAVAILVDESGREYRISSAGQEALDGETTKSAACESEIPPGGSCISDLVFELPRDVRVSHLRVSGGGKAGDLLDTIFYGRKIIKLESE